MSVKKKITLSVMVSIVGVVAIFSVASILSYAYFTANISGNENASSIQVDTARLATVQFTDSAQISANNMLPGTSVTKTFSVAMNGQNTIDMSYRVYMYWKNSGITDMVYTLSGGGTPLRVMPINTVQNTYKKEEIATGTFSANTSATHNYTLTLTFRETGVNQNEQQGKTFSAYLQVEFSVGGTTICYNNDYPEGYNCTLAGSPVPTNLVADLCTAGSNKLNCSILEDNSTNGKTIQTVASDTMFASISNSAQTGLWIENRAGKTENYSTVYFYRGAVQNNYVDFAGFKWRIVRINEDGSVKLILGGNTTTDGYGGTTKYNTSQNLAEHVDYNHATNALRVANEDWYSNDTKGNLDEYESYIADTKFCNDKSVASTSRSNIYYEARDRLYTNKTPQYKCPNASDNYIYKIGALTADEVAYAGGLYGSNNASYYLYDNAKSSGNAGYWWLLSPYYYFSGYAFVFIVNGSDGPGYLVSNYVSNTLGFRPAVSLKSDTLILEGVGSFDDPYVITE